MTEWSLMTDEWWVTDDWHKQKRPRIWSFCGISWNSVKFRGNMEIPRLGSKFRGPQKTVVPNDDEDDDTITKMLQWHCTISNVTYHMSAVTATVTKKFSSYLCVNCSLASHSTAILNTTAMHTDIAMTLTKYRHGCLRGHQDRGHAQWCQGQYQKSPGQGQGHRLQSQGQDQYHKLQGQGQSLKATYKDKVEKKWQNSNCWNHEQVT